MLRPINSCGVQSAQHRDRASRVLLARDCKRELVEQWTRGAVMKRAALAITIASVITGSAAAADYPVRGAVRVGCPAAAFDGAYIGANGGGAWWSTNRTDQDAVVGEVTTYNQKTAGGILGGQLGYNW